MSVTLLQFDHLVSHGVRHFVSTRTGGRSPHPFSSLNIGLHSGDCTENILDNRQRLQDAVNRKFSVVGPEPSTSSLQLHFGKQTHGSATAVLTTGISVSDRLPADAFWTIRPNQYACIYVADCVPILLFDPSTGAACSVHAGREGMAAGIIESAVSHGVRHLGIDPGRLMAGIGPAIGVCCYTVDAVTADRFHSAIPPAAAFTRMPSRTDPDWRLNLRQTAQAVLEIQGVRSANIEHLSMCTACSTDQFFSHRASGGFTGRFAAGIAALSSGISLDSSNLFR